MGSGRGKSRRANTLTPDAALARWLDFVDQQGLGGRGLDDYYLGAELARDSVSKAKQCLRLAQELFGDFVSLGVLELPRDHVAEDYELRVQEDINLYGVIHKHLYLQNLRIGRTTAVNKQEMSDWFHSDDTMGCHRITEVIRYFREALNEVR